MIRPELVSEAPFLVVALRRIGKGTEGRLAKRLALGRNPASPVSRYRAPSVCLCLMSYGVEILNNLLEYNIIQVCKMNIY